jgi:hypothetical protein
MTSVRRDTAGAGWRSSYVDAQMALINANAAAGRDTYLYEQTYVEVDSTLNEEALGTFDIAELQQLGLEGWEVVGIVPRTTSVLMSNAAIGRSMGASWGVGMGGNVIGVYILLKYTISPSNLEAARADVLDYFNSRADRQLDQSAKSLEA